MTENIIKNVKRPLFLSNFTCLEESTVADFIAKKTLSTPIWRAKAVFREGNPFDCIGIEDRSPIYEITLRRHKYDMDAAQQILRDHDLELKDDVDWLGESHLQLEVRSCGEEPADEHALMFSFRGQTSLETGIAFKGDPSKAECANARLTRSLAHELLSYIVQALGKDRAAFIGEKHDGLGGSPGR